jgi:hypothetical protein
MKISVSTTIDRPVGGVWRWYAVDHIRNHPRWDPEMELEQLSDGPIGLGTRIRRVNRRFEEPIAGEMQIVAWEPEHLMGVQIHAASAIGGWSGAGGDLAMASRSASWRSARQRSRGTAAAPSGAA